MQGPSRGDPSKTADPSVQTHLHPETADTHQDIDVANVEAIRDAIRDGRLEVHADRIADSLIASVRELLEG